MHLELEPRRKTIETLFQIITIAGIVGDMHLLHCTVVLFFRLSGTFC